jgi:hypothetical protein
LGFAKTIFLPEEDDLFSCLYQFLVWERHSSKEVVLFSEVCDLLEEGCHFLGETNFQFFFFFLWGGGGMFFWIGVEFPLLQAEYCWWGRALLGGVDLSCLGHFLVGKINSLLENIFWRVWMLCCGSILWIYNNHYIAHPHLYLQLVILSRENVNLIIYVSPFVVVIIEHSVINK